MNKKQVSISLQIDRILFHIFTLKQNLLVKNMIFMGYKFQYRYLIIPKYTWQC